ncbi:MAG: hypothetical protein CL891_02695 [Dehalococcoidia bacterium]|nr:hypothetical protein [Dehalococcoidia bacterium]
MDINEILFIGLRWVHSIAAISWVGGGIFYLLVLRPFLRSYPNIKEAQIAANFRDLVSIAMAILLVSGAILTFERLTSGFIGPSYVIVLCTKIAIAAYMFYLVRFVKSGLLKRNESMSKPRTKGWISLMTGNPAVVVMGLVVFLLADVLSAIFENGLRL